MDKREDKLEKAILLVRDLIIERLQKEKYCEAQTMGQALASLLVYRRIPEVPQLIPGRPC